MTHRLIVSALTVCATVPALVFGLGVNAAYAETSDAVTETLIQTSLSGLDTTVTDPVLLAELQQDVSEAIEVGIIDPAIVQVVEETVTDPTSTPSPEETTAPTDTELADLIDENLAEESDAWTEEEPAWAAAFEAIRADFELCRTDGQSTSSCARTLGFQLQIAHAQAELATLDEAIAAVATLPEEEQASALAELEAQRAELEAHLVRATAKLEAAVSSGVAGATPEVQARLNAVVGEVRGRAQAPALPEQAQQNKNGSSNTVVPQTPGQQDVVSPESSTQQGPGISVEQAPGKSGNAGKPANPGGQGQGNSNKNNR
ncbi:hypothetical protein [Aurantimicrobium sp. MWH-Uga1]|uniref:hypothetical protein n=1 Tax=Aurantimicrobium sp. MWH-Uga1 TaxID=2079575 RepID=UPI000DEDDFC1|nr:hypothetical protein [Aurantimicrobium sp. MWH-Uga1]AXE55175.1 hypothetical protein AURUGA1_01505 [Aurantimicrobium sp. MWH-Uga1]